MSGRTPQIEAILDALAEHCCETLDGKDELDRARIKDLLRSLSTNGWERHSDEEPPLAAILEKRVLSSCKEPAMHRGAALSSLTAEIQRQYDAVKPDAASPDEDSDEV